MIEMEKSKEGKVIHFSPSVNETDEKRYVVIRVVALGIAILLWMLSFIKIQAALTGEAGWGNAWIKEVFSNGVRFAYFFLLSTTIPVSLSIPYRFSRNFWADFLVFRFSLSIVMSIVVIRLSMTWLFPIGFEFWNWFWDPFL